MNIDQAHWFTFVYVTAKLIHEFVSNSFLIAIYIFRILQMPINNEKTKKKRSRTDSFRTVVQWNLNRKNVFAKMKCRANGGGI